MLDFEQLANEGVVFGLWEAAKTLTLFLIGSFLVAYGAIPALRNRKFPKFRTDDESIRLSSQILFDRILKKDGKTIVCTDGTILQVIKVEGVDLSARAEKRGTFYNFRHQWLNEMRKFPQTDLRTVTIRRLRPHESDVECYRPFTWLHVFMQKHMGSFQTAFTNEHFIILTVMGGTSNASYHLNRAVGLTLQRLQEYRPEVLTAKPSNEHQSDGRSPLLTYWGTLLNPGIDARFRYRPRPKRIDSIDDFVDDRRLAHDLIKTSVGFWEEDPREQEEGLINFRFGSRKIYGGIQRVGTWGGSITEMFVSRLYSEPIEFTIFQTMDVLPTDKALAAIEDKATRAVNFDILDKIMKQGNLDSGRGARLGSDYQVAQQILDENQKGFSARTMHQFFIMVYGKTKQEIVAAQDRLDHLAMEYDINLVPETDFTEVVWKLLFPPQKHPYCEVGLFAGNVAKTATFDNASQGHHYCDWGDRPSLYLRTLSGSPYAYIPHFRPSRKKDQEMPSAHTNFIGGTGGGKTTLAMLLATSSLCYDNHYIFCFDRLDGMFVPITAFGGTYNYLTARAEDHGGASCQLNPLLMLHGANVDQDDVTFVVNWIRDHLTGVGSSDEVSAAAIEMAVHAIAKASSQEIPSDKCNLKAVYAAMQNCPAKIKLEKFVKGQYRHLFNARRDSLISGSGIANRLNAYDVTETLKDDVLVNTVFPYLEYAIRRTMKKRGASYTILFDETRAFVQSAVTKAWFEHSLLEVRKARGAVYCCFQQIEDIINNGMMELLSGQCKTWFFFRAGESAKADAYVTKAGLNDDEFAFICDDHGRGRRFTSKDLPWGVLMKRDGAGSIILDTDLRKAGKEYAALFASGDQPANKLRSLIHAYGHQEGVERYLREAAA